ncbi:aminoglycoside phosphotransferase family protein [Paenibacillus sp. FSL W8-0186]|uniref:Aminoglycoside phosphotransferase n=1 Tax=Paenibacillus woosongensis TaxID=307580 RepID=A0ABQ4MRI5_9BACL|nr:aminoglycoside phosphotransferase family protein [Paenibacillus woosongensis]GIP58544.1 aminoglycoside phosphotransferase [Paenibacillus woosongensis]
MLEQVGQGRTADIFVAGDNKVLKLYKKGFPIEAIHEEYEVSQYVHDLGINVPRAFEMIERDGRLGIIFERVPGTSLLHLMTRRPLRIRRFSRTLAALHHHVHSHSVADLSRNHKEILAHNIQSAPLLTDAEKSKIIHQLQGLPEDHKLCHGDYHPDNVLVTDPNNSCVIDWMTGMAGHPLGDLARSVLLLTYGTLPEGTPKTKGLLINFFRKRIKKEYVRHYMKLANKDYAEVDPWILPVAAARLSDGIPDEEKNALLLEIRARLKTIT